jgi:hypothetical protein
LIEGAPAVETCLEMLFGSDRLVDVREGPNIGRRYEPVGNRLISVALASESSGPAMLVSSAESRRLGVCRLIRTDEERLTSETSCQGQHSSGSFWQSSVWSDD